MKNNLLTKIAVDLGELYHQRAELRIRDRKLDELREKRVVEITPKCWPGSNETERKCSMTLAIAADEALQSIDGQLGDVSDRLEIVAASIHALEAEKEAIQWTIRDLYLPSPILTEIADQPMGDEMDFRSNMAI